jgi:hypothetical protein
VIRQLDQELIKWPDRNAKSRIIVSGGGDSPAQNCKSVCFFGYETLFGNATPDCYFALVHQPKCTLWTANFGVGRRLLAAVQSTFLSVDRPALISDGDYFLGVDPSNDPCRFGRLTKMNSEIQIGKDGLPKLRAAYFAWWEANTNKDISTLGHDWATGKRPLAGSIYALVNQGGD